MRCWPLVLGLFLCACPSTHTQPDAFVRDGAAGDAGPGEGCLPLPEPVLSFSPYLCLRPNRLTSDCESEPLFGRQHEVLPVSLTVDGDDVLIEALLAGNAAWPESYDGEHYTVRARYRLRTTELGPIILLERTDPVPLELWLEEWRARNRERDAGAPAFCVTVGGLDVWMDRDRSFLDPLLEARPILWAGLVRARSSDQLWTAELQILPLACEPDSPCVPELTQQGAWVLFGERAGTADAPFIPVAARRPFGCCLQPVCELRATGITDHCAPWIGASRCDDDPWLERACAATSLDELPPIERWPCHDLEEELTCAALCP